MAKTRLTNADRDAIRDAIITHKFGPIEAGLAAEEAALAIQTRAKVYGEYLATIEAAPEGAFPVVGRLYANISGRRIALAFSRNFQTSCRVFDKHAHGETMLAVDDRDAHGKKVLAWAERSEANRVERSKLKDVVRGTLAAFTTFDDLKKGWPEAESFIVERWAKRPDYTANVPAVAIQELSEALDLPPEIAEAA